MHALTRKPTSPAAKATEALGAIIFPGNFGEPENIEKAAKWCYGVFLNVYPVFTDPDGEVKHARNIISACRRAGVKKMVYSSATRVSDYPKMIADGRLELGSFPASYFRSKHQIQEEVKKAGFDGWTIL